MELEDLKIQLALMQSKIENNHNEQMIRLGSLETLVEERIDRVDEKVDHNKANSDVAMEKVRRDHEDLHKRVSSIEVKMARMFGMGAFGAILASLLAFVVANGTAIGKAMTAFFR